MSICNKKEKGRVGEMNKGVLIVKSSVSESANLLNEVVKSLVSEKLEMPLN